MFVETLNSAHLVHIWTENRGQVTIVGIVWGWHFHSRWSSIPL